MMGVINSDDTVGFTSKQVEVQLDTLKRKMQTIKDDLQSMVMDVGANGGLTWECKIVCVKRNCTNLLYAPYWGNQS